MNTGSYTVQGTEPDTIVYLDTSRVLDEVYSSLGLPALIVMVMLIYRQQQPQHHGGGETPQGYQQPVYDCAVHRATTWNVVAAIPNRANQSRISGLPYVYLNKLVAPPSPEPGVRAFALFTDLLLSPSSSLFSLGHPHPQLRETSAVARSLATIIVHVGGCLQLCQA